MQLGSNTIKVLQVGESERYLGRKLSLDVYHETEIRNRISAGWAAFAKYKVALCNRACSLGRRLRLLDTVVTPTVVYASSTWTMKAEWEQLLQTTGRRMLRLIVAVRRGATEMWTDYIQRATHICERQATYAGLQSWVDLQKQRKCCLAIKIALMESDRWPARILHWAPWHRCLPHRDVGHPLRRWTDDL